MTGEADRWRDEALTWAARVQDPTFEDWDEHAAWLASDSGNAERYYDAVLALETGLEVVLAAARKTSVQAMVPIAHNDDEPHPSPVGGFGRRWATGAGIGIAACLAGLLFPPNAPRQQNILLHGVAGQAQQFHLPDGSMVTLNGPSVLSFMNGARRTATLERGEAFIRVAHDSAHPFELHTDDQIFRDVGTAFDVSRLDGTVELTVAEGRWRSIRMA